MKKPTKFSFTIAMFLITINSFAANFYWVNGSGNWSDTSHWAFSSGGTIFHNQWPQSTDNVFFDANSFTAPGQIVTIDQGIASCADMTWTTLPTAFPIIYGDSLKTLRIWGSLTIATVIGFNFTGDVILEANTMGKTITTGGTQINFHLTFNGTGGGWTFQDALMGSSVINFINGNLNTNNQIINASAFYSTSSSFRTLLMGSSIFNLKGYTNGLWNINPIGMTINAGTSTINGTSTIGSGGNFFGGGLTYYNMSFADSAAIFGNNTFHDVAFVSDGFISGNNSFHDVSFFLNAIINGNSTFNNVIMGGNGSINGNNSFNNLTFTPWWTYTLQAGATQTIGNICAQGTGALPIRIQSSIAGTPAIISKASGSICWDYVRVSDITATGGAIFNAGLAPTNSQDLGGNTGLLFTGGCTALSCLSSCTPPSITMQPSNSSVCVGSNAVFTITATGTDLTYQWQINQGFGFINLSNNIQYSGVTTNTLNIIAPAIIFNGYQYRCAAVGACPIVSMSNAATLTVKQSPTVTVNSAIICSGQTAILTASVGTVFVPVAPLLPPSPPLPPPPIITSYIWSTGETTNPISVAPSTTTTYTVTGTTNGCSNTAIATVTVNPVPVVTATVSTSTVTISATGGTPPYTGTGIFTGLALGTYFFTVTDANGCTGNTTVTITEPENNCVNAKAFAVNTDIMPPTETQSSTTQWYYFTAENIETSISLLELSSNSNNKLLSMKLWEGNCTNLTLLASDTISNMNDTTLTINTNALISNSVYYVQIKRVFGAVSDSKYFINIHYKTPLTCANCPDAAIVDICNFVCNGGFEYYTSPPDATYQIQRACSWDTPTWGRPSYFNANSPNGSSVGVPTNIFNILPLYGNNNSLSYANFRAGNWINPYDIGNPHDYIYQQLRYPLVANQTYTVKFYVALSDNSEYGVKSLGALFTVNNTDGNMATYYQIYPDVNLDQQLIMSNIFYDNVNSWALVSQTFVASAAFNYIVIGDFGSDDLSNRNVANSAFVNGVSNYFIDDISVSPTNNPITITATPQTTICSGQTVTLTATGGNGIYTWTSTAGNIPYTSSSINVSPTTTTTYTASYVPSNYPINAGCSISQSIEITINPLATVSVAHQAYCSGVTIPATNFTSLPTGATFSWTNSNTAIGLNATSGTGNVPTFIGTNNTNAPIIAIITVTPILNGCAGTPSPYIITINPSPPAPIITGSVSACQLSGNIYTISNYNGSSAYSVPSILPSSAGTATSINTSGLFTLNWNSTNGGGIFITLTDINGCTNSSDLTVFPCCSAFGHNAHTFNDGANSASFSSAYGSNSVTGEHFSINGTFTVDQNTTMTWDKCDVTLGQDAVINITNGSTLIITDRTSHLYACNNMWTGIKIQPSAILKITGALIEDAKTAIQSINGGYYNLDNAYLNRNYKHMELTQHAGTHSGVIINSNFTCQAFPPATLATLNFPYLGFRTSVGIDIKSVDNITIGQTGALNTNNFKNMNTGIQSDKSSVVVINNTFKNIDFSAFPNLGIAAIKATGNPLFSHFPLRTLTVGDGTNAGSNTFKDCENGIFAIQNMNAFIRLNDFKQINKKGVFISTSSSHNTVLIDNNDFATTAFGIHCLKNTICNTTIQFNKMDNMKDHSTGVWIQEISSMSVGAIYKVFDNKIKTVLLGIRAENLNKATIDNNKIETEPFTSAVYLSRGIEVTGNYGTRIISNDVKIMPTTYATKNGGIYASLSPASYINCNTTANMGYGIKCAGQMPSDIYNNAMIKNFYGFWLDNNGFVGIQDGTGITGFPSCYNKWTIVPGSTTSKKTFTSGLTDGSLSPIVYKTGASPNSLNSSYNPNPTFAAPSAFLFTLIPNSIGSSYGPVCSVVMFPRLLKQAQDIALGNINFSGNNANGKWLNKQGLLVNIKNDSIDVSSDGILQTFVNQSASDNLGKLTELNSIITDPTKYDTTDMVAAQALSTTISPTNDIETNQKLIIDIIINNYLSNTSYTSAQINDLRSLAYKCPFTDGLGVYQARVLLAEIDTLGTVYYNVCETGEAETRMLLTNNDGSQDENSSLAVYPNPATNQLTLNYQIESTDIAVFEIYNLIGEKVMMQKLNPNVNEKIISVVQLNSGVYFYKYSINEQIIKTDKLVIVK